MIVDKSRNPAFDRENGEPPSHSHRLGELLIAAGILRAERLNEALQLAKKTSSPVGRVLLMFGVKQGEIDSALHIQQLIRSSTITPDLGIKALQTSLRSSRPVEDVLEESGCSREYVIRNSLGELLIASGMITRPALAEAIRMSMQVGMTLGKYLSLTGTIPTSVLFEALNVQLMLCDGKITHDQAVEQLKDATIKRRAITGSVVTVTHNSIKHRDEIKLGELLTMAEVVSDTDVLTAIELGLFKDQPVGQILVESKLIPDTLVEPALTLQRMVKERQVRSLQAANILMQIHKRGISLEQALQEFGVGRRTIEGWKEALELLRSAGMLGDHNCRYLVSVIEKDPSDVSRVIGESDLVNEGVFQAAIRCNTLLKEKRLRQEQAIIALHYCANSRSTLDDALRDLSFVV